MDYTYDIGEYDVTDSQYATFLNDVDPTGANTLALYSGTNDAEDGIAFNSSAANGLKYSVISGYANMPVVDVDFWDTLRFVNWMNNGEGDASTETGAYTLIGGNTDGTGTPSNAAALLSGSTVEPNAGATVWLPNENEWYKAAYYDPQLNGGLGGYYTYATQSNTTPGNVIGNGTNEANYLTSNGYSVTQSSSYNSSRNYLTAVGSYTDSASYYGTYDQNGDVVNWTATTSPVDALEVSGGYWYSGYQDLSSYGAHGVDSPSLESEAFLGFRVASKVTAVPEPSTWAMMLTGMGSLLLFRRRR